MRIVLDMETDGLIETVTKIHCISYYDIDTKQSVSLTGYDEIKQLILSDNLTIIGHNVKRFDIPVLELLLGIKIRARVIDSLALSWYLYPLRATHNLEDWGRDLGIHKPFIENWADMQVEDYIHRCQEDVKINVALFDIQIAYLNVLYPNGATKLINYLMFKMDCAREQEEVKWRLDVEKCNTNLDYLQKEIIIKTDALRAAMPKVPIYKFVEKPKELLRKDGTISVRGLNWLTLLTKQNLPEYHNGTIKVLVKEEEGNPASFTQIKKWLFDLGWIPQEFKYVRKDYDSPIRAIPQISNKDGICPSVVELFDKAPGLFNIESLSILRNRKTTLEGFLQNKDDDDFLKAEILGFTNTLRFQHTKIVNLPTLMKDPNGLVRGVLIAPDGDSILCGVDISGLEETTKHHYMYPYDPEYVKEMRTPVFDAHLDVAIAAGLVTRDVADWYKWIKAEDNRKELYLPFVKEEFLSLLETQEGKALKAVVAKIRDTSKKTNFAAVYGAGIPKMVLTANITVALATSFYKAYWKRNWSVKKVAESCTVKTINDQMWIYNPISDLWLSLRSLKDRFSTLNQSSGVYCFDTFVRRVRMKGIKMCGQFHDEIVTPLKKCQRDFIEGAMRKSIEETNKELNLNVELSISIQFGDRYADIH